MQETHFKAIFVSNWYIIGIFESYNFFVTELKALIIKDMTQKKLHGIWSTTKFEQ